MTAVDDVLAGVELVSESLPDQALGLARSLAELLPDEPEVHGLHALLELRTETGTGQIALDRAELLAARGSRVGRFYLRAKIAQAKTAEPIDWRRVTTLYDALVEVATDHPTEVERAEAHGHAFGAPAGLAVLDDLPASAEAPGLPALRAELLARAAAGSH